MSGTYRVRFAEAQSCPLCKIPKADGFESPLSNPPSHRPAHSDNAKATKSRSGCKECKLRRVKCDETFPVCLRCQRRGTLCLRPAEPWPGAVQPNKKIMNYWLENTSRMMTVTPEDNPLSFPLVEHLLYTPSLLYAVQSIGAGQEGFFYQTALKTSLQQRGLAIQSLRKELQNPDQIKPATVLSVFLLGVSASWTEDKPRCYGKEHMSGARTLLERLLVDEDKQHDPVVQYILGWHLYWDMTCAFVADPGDYKFSAQAERSILQAVESGQEFHSMTGISSVLLYHLASVGRHCRRVVQTGAADPDLEASFERTFLAWKPRHSDRTLVEMSLAYRNHGLVMLYEICGRRDQPQTNGEYRGLATRNDTRTRHAIRSLAFDSLERLLQTPVDAACINFHSMPLLTAGAQLQHNDTIVRVQVVERFKALYSTNRIAVNLWAIELLQELWDLRDNGNPTSWLELLLSKDWTLNFA
ncbi:hypothetical protein K456DRAFT_1746127 [Colletotrichum gloeosporioides 23]|nr:hypothetical protein K456DRAFT_1746127 [Colletotrichum gloeosporioides 23]